VSCAALEQARAAIAIVSTHFIGGIVKGCGIDDASQCAGPDKVRPAVSTAAVFW
jgi:hypothetical protein